MSLTSIHTHIMNQNFEHLNAPIKSVHDNPGAPGVANLCFVEPPKGGYYNLLATIYSTDSWPEQAYIERRMVAAWNACVGISTDVLEERMVSEALWVDLSAQRDELLAVLEKFVKYAIECNDDSFELDHAIAAIAKAKAKAKATKK